MKTFLTVVGVIAGVVLLALAAFAVLGAMGIMHFEAAPLAGRFAFARFGFGFVLLSLVLSVLFWGLVIGGVVWLVTSLARGSGPATAGGPAGMIMPAREAPLDVLKMRYAKGEITKEQYEEMKGHLGV